MNLLALRDKCNYKDSTASSSRVNEIMFLTKAMMTLFQLIAKLGRCNIP